MKANAAQELINKFAEIKDPRINRRKLHSLTDIIALSIIAVIGSAEGWEDIEEFGRAKESWLREFLELRNGIPTHDTIARVMQRIDSGVFEACFMAWVSSLREGSTPSDEVIAIDGKSVRHSFDRAAGQSPLHLVSAYAVNQKLLLGQQSVDGKSNEITAIPALLELLHVTGATVTIDAMGCQKEIAKKIRAKNADYVLALKGNHPNLHSDVVEFFAHKEYSEQKSSTTTTLDCEHGRIEKRTYTVTSDLSSLCLKNEWADLVSIGMVDSCREVNGVAKNEKRYYLTSHIPDAALFASKVRGHWGIENSFHWVLDVTFREDESRIRAGNGAHNFAILRRIAFNLTKAYQPPKPKSVKRKRKLAFWSDNYILNILFAGNQQIQGI